MFEKKNFTTPLILFLACVALDRFTKFWAVHNLSIRQIKIADYLNFSLEWNRGVSWSLFKNVSPLGLKFLVVFIILVIVIFLIYTFVQYINHHDVTFETFVLAGALSNVVDRFLYGAVLDFIDFHVKGWHWPTFNVADFFIVLGIIGIIVKNFYNAYVYKN